MPIIYRTTPYDDNYLTYLQKLGEDNWIYCWPLWDKLVFRKEEKRVVSKKEIVEDDRFQEFYWVYKKLEIQNKIYIMLRHRLKVLQNNDLCGRSVLCKTAEQLHKFLHIWNDSYNYIKRYANGNGIQIYQLASYFFTYYWNVTIKKLTGDEE